MGIKHSTTKASGDRGLASEWNDNHVIDSDVDFQQFEIQTAVVENRTDWPAGPVVGQIIYRTDRNCFYTWDGTDWQACSGARKPATFVVSASDSNDRWRADYRCDGTADQTEINGAISALPANGGKVILLEGTYYLSGTITIAKSGVSLVGCGEGTKIFLNNSTNTNIITVGDGVNGYSNILIGNLKIDGNHAEQASNGRVIFFNKYITKSKIEQVHAINGERGILLDTNCNHNIITNCKIESTGQDSDSYGIELSTSSNFNKITNNMIYQCHNGIWIYGSHYNTITGNTVIENDNNGIIISDCSYNIVQGNTCNDNGVVIEGSSGILLWRTGLGLCTYNTLIGNVCIDTNNTQDFGIAEANDSVNLNIIVGNVATGNDVANYLKQGANTILEHNQ